MSHENVEVVRRGVACANSGDWDALFEAYHPEVEYRNLRTTPDRPNCSTAGRRCAAPSKA